MFELGAIVCRHEPEAVASEVIASTMPHVGYVASTGAKCTEPFMAAESVATFTQGSPSMTKSKKPKGFKAFDQLARKLVKVPKAEVTKREAKRKKRGK
jgi:hypothetical protein